MPILMYIRVKVLAGVKRELLKELGENRLEIHVKEPALANLANKRVVEIVAFRMGISVKKVKIISGHHSPTKILAVEI